VGFLRLTPANCIHTGRLISEYRTSYGPAEGETFSLLLPMKNITAPAIISSIAPILAKNAPEKKSLPSCPEAKYARW
jgi:hypothetical protein